MKLNRKEQELLIDLLVDHTTSIFKFGFKHQELLEDTIYPIIDSNFLLLHKIKENK